MKFQSNSELSRSRGDGNSSPDSKDVLKIAVRDRSTSGHSAESDIGGISTELFTEENSIHTLLPKDELTSTEKQKDSNLHEKNSKLKNRRPTGWILSTRQNATKKHDENENIKKKSTIQTYAVKVAEADDNINVKEESGKLLECYEVDMIYGTALHDCTDEQLPEKIMQVCAN